MSEEKFLSQKLKSLLVECDKYAYSDDDSFSESVINSSDFSNIELSNLSEISEIEPINLSIESEKKKPQRKTQVKKISRLPIRRKKNIENINSVNHSLSGPKPKSFPNKVVSVMPIGIIQPIGINYSKYSQMTICIFQGSGFIQSLGVRSTYVVLNIDDSFDQITTPICWNHNEESFYNFGITIDIKSVDWNECTPFFNVFDILQDKSTQLIGSGVIKLQEAREEGTVCVVLHNDWVPIMNDFYQNCGRIKMTMVLHNNENIENYLKQNEDPPLVQTLHFDDIIENEAKNEAAKKAYSIGELDDDSLINSSDFSTQTFSKNKLWTTAKWESITKQEKNVKCTFQSPPEKNSVPQEPQPKICFVDSSALIDSEDDDLSPMKFDNSQQDLQNNGLLSDSNGIAQFHKTKRKGIYSSSNMIRADDTINKAFHFDHKPRSKNLDLELTLGSTADAELLENICEPTNHQCEDKSSNKIEGIERSAKSALEKSHELIENEVPKLYQYSPPIIEESKPSKKMFFSSRRTPAAKKSSENVQKYFDSKWNE